MKDGLYHKNLGLPVGAANEWGRQINLGYSQHARQAANADRYGKVPLFDWVEFDASDVVEVEIYRGKPVKAVLRVPYNRDLDIVYVLNLPAGGSALVRTVWFNLSNDNHKTLNVNNYQRL